MVQICQDISLRGSVHVLPDQHGDRIGQIQVHCQVTEPPGEHSGGGPPVPSHCHHLPPPRFPHRLQDQAGAHGTVIGEYGYYLCLIIAKNPFIS